MLADIEGPIDKSLGTKEVGGALKEARHRRREDAPGGRRTCVPGRASRCTGFPVNPGAAMPVVNGCRKQDYAVLIVVGGLPATR